MAWHHWRNLFLFLIFSILISVFLKGQETVPAELTLSQAKAILLTNSPLLQAEKLNQEIARGLFIDVSKRPNVELSVTAAGLGSRPEAGTFLDNQEFSATVSYSLETRGKRRKRTQLASGRIDVSESDFEDLIRRLLWELKQRYYRVLLAQRGVKFAKEISAKFDQLVNLTRVRYQNGEVSGLELRRIEAEQYRFQEDVIAADVLLENAQDGLLALLGYEEFDANVRAVDSFSSSFNPPPLVQLKQISLSHRKDLEAQEERIEQARVEVALEQARSVPNLRVFGGYRRDFGHDGAVIGVKMPLFIFNKNQGSIGSAQVHHEQERLTLQDLKIRIFEEIQLALNQLDGNRRRRQALTSVYLEKIQQVRDISETAYRLGSVSLLELLDAERTYREAVRRQNQALYNLQISWARLELAVGRDLP